MAEGTALSLVYRIEANVPVPDGLDADYSKPLPRHADGRIDWTNREHQRSAYHRPTHASRSISGRVVHIQSPKPDTFIQAGGREGLGVELPFFGIQFKRLGKRGVAFEIGVEDARGREGTIRLSSWKVSWTSLAKLTSRIRLLCIPGSRCCISH